MRQLQGSGPRLGPRMMWLVSVAPNVISPPPSDPLHRHTGYSAQHLAEELKQLI
jgi:hypothetical protein